jgi:hypothetical protein
MNTPLNPPTRTLRQKRIVPALAAMAFRRTLFTMAVALAGPGLLAATYYVSPTGNDSNSGTTQAQAFRTVAKINQLSLKPGDSVLFEGGATFSDAGLYLTYGDGGSSSSPVTIQSYGTGRATLAPASDVRAIDIQNVAGFIIRDLILVGKGLTTSTVNGVNAYCGLNGGVKLTRVELLNLDISGFRNGIYVQASSNNTFSGFKDLLIADCDVSACRRNGIEIRGDYISSTGSPGRKSHENITIRDCRITGVTGDPLQRTGHSGSGIILSAVKGGLIERCVAWNNGGLSGNYPQTGDLPGMSYGGGSCGIWTWNSEYVTIRRCLVYNQKTNNGIPDGDGFDLDGGTTHAAIEYCYSYNNDGTGYLIYTFDNAPRTSNCVLRYNVSWGDGRTHMASGFHISRGNGADSVVEDIDIHNNLVYSEGPADGGPCIGVYGSRPMRGIRVRNNVFVIKGRESFVYVDSIVGRDFVTFQANLYHAVDGNYGIGWKWGGSTTAYTFNSLIKWRVAYGSPETASNQSVGLQADPQIAALTTVTPPTTIAELLTFQGFRLGETSPAINAGLDLRKSEFGSLPMPSSDFYGHPVPHGGAYDLGPFESPYPLQAPSLAIEASAGTPAGQVQLSFTPLRSDLTYEIESSSDLKLWTNFQTADPAAIQPGQAFLIGAADISPARFFRLRIRPR